MGNPANSVDEPLNRRHQSEKEFHDSKYGSDGDNSLPSHYVDNPTLAFYDAMMLQLGAIEGLRVLDLGCGDGWITADLIKRGAVVVGIDISDEAVKATTRVLTELKADDRGYARVMGAEKLDFPDESFDVVVGFAILHHLDMPIALGEIFRVLKPGGRAAFAEPLEGNPLLRLYRRSTPNFRTPDEAPLQMAKFKTLITKYASLDWRAHAFLAQGVIFMSGRPALRPVARWLKRPMQAVDSLLFSLVPPIRHWAWYASMVLTKSS